ncbi:anthranilate synthase component I family protein [Marivirga atlantica]|uniref:Anthranilate synthase component I family protein n=1 Tax=Marivirga atlantica TaxID=1548457 RepID=A0A937DKQ5_9BACT|nr:anthranilate synthase component I family protein [Marivirga atlantica]MBL0767180.1 anthranilate synthase component I family protein [Marivirga atlantica]
MIKALLTLKNKTEKKLIVEWAQQFNYCLFFNPSDTVDYPYSTFPNRLVFADEQIPINNQNVFQSLKNRLNELNTELYGYLSYDIKEQTHQVIGKNTAQINWPNSVFFKPKAVIDFDDKNVQITSQNAYDIKQEIELYLKNKQWTDDHNKIHSFKAFFDEDEYINTVKKLQNHILEGDIYEINFCINYEVSASYFNPLATFFKLSKHSPTPFASFLKCNSKYVLCASPERFIKFENDKIISQPIKGTAKRSSETKTDNQLKEELYSSEKERAENMMIVDLVRNDLAQSSIPGSVKVEELFGIYSFKYVHQMISTIASIPKPGTHVVDIIEKAFPMGSMTGAPKKRAIELIDHYENVKRSVFSGSIGYISNEVFDFNVVIRSIYFDAKTLKLNFEVGSAITYDSDPEAEYAECQLKAEAIKNILEL